MVASREKTKKNVRTKTKKTTKIKEDKKYDYSDFIKVTQRDIILSHIDDIKNICEEYAGINEVPIDIWNKLNNIVIEVSIAAKNAEQHGSYYSLEPKKRVTYTITQRVREMQRKKFILNQIVSMSNNEDIDYHYCNLIFLHIAIWLSENSRVSKQKE